MTRHHHAPVRPHRARRRPSATRSGRAPRRHAHGHRLARLVLALALAAPAPFALSQTPAPYWRAVEITPGGGVGNALTPYALNNQGWVVGSFNENSGIAGFVWGVTPGAAPQRLPLVDAYGIGHDGTIVGVARGSTLQQIGYDTPGYEYAVSVSPAGAIRVLTPTHSTPGQTVGAAYAVNGNGSILGLSSGPGPATGASAVLWAADGSASFVDISLGSRGAGLGGRSSLALNDAGTVLGGFDQLQTWTAEGGRRDLGVLPGASASTGVDINNSGLIIGNAFFGDAATRGFVYDAAAASFTALSGLGSGSSTAWGLNERGDVVGQSGVAGRVDTLATWWRPGGQVIDLNSLNVLELSGVRLQNAIDINDRGQILVSGMAVDANGQVTATGLRHWVLSECLRCGQILPNPNPSGALLSVGADWGDAHNALDFQNYGGLDLGTLLENRAGASFTNRGEVAIGQLGDWSNSGRLLNDLGGRLSVSGGFSNFEGGVVVNRGVVQVLDGAAFTLWDATADGGWLNDAGSTFAQRGGAFFNGGLFVNSQATFRQDAGVLSNNGQFTLLSSVATFAGTVTNGGRMDFVQDVLEAPGVRSQVAVQGQFRNLAEGTVRMDGGAFLTVEDGGHWVNQGTLTLEGTATQVSVRRGGTLHNDGGTLHLGAGTVLRIEQDAGPVQPQIGMRSPASPASPPPVEAAFRQSGQLTLSRGAKLEIGPNQVMEVLGGQVTSDGVVFVEAGARIANLGIVQLKAGAGLELDSGARFDQSAGELLVAAGALILGTGVLDQTGGTTTVDGAVNLPLATFRGGVLRGTGSFAGNVVLSGALDLRPGRSPGTLHFGGDLRIEEGVTLQLEVDDYRSFDRLVVAGTADIAALRVSFAPGADYRPELDDHFAFIDAAQVVQQDAGAVTLDASALGAGWVSPLRVGPGGVSTTLDNTSAFELGLVEAGTTVRVDPGQWAYSRQLQVGGTLEVAGRMTHRQLAADPATGITPAGSLLHVEGSGALTIGAEALFTNRGEILHQGQLVNAGEFQNRAGALLTSDRNFDNHGLLVNDGLIVQRFGTARNTGTWLERGRTEIRPGAVLENVGHLQIEGTLVSEGLMLNAGTVHVRATGVLTGQPEGAAAPPMFANDQVYQQIGSALAVTRVDGLMAMGEIRISDGVLEGQGRISGPLSMGGGTTLRAGAAGVAGRLSLDGPVVLGGGFLDLGVGPEGASLLDFGASLDITGYSTVMLTLLPGADLGPGSAYTLLTVSGLLTGAELLTGIVVEGSPNGPMLWSPPEGVVSSFRWEGQSLVFEVTAVPEPGTWALMLFGALAVALRARGRGVR